MNPVAGGWTSHKIRGDGDYEARKRAAMAQGGANSYIQGVQSVMDDGAGEAIANTRTKYGNVNLMPQQVLQGRTSNFQQKDVPGNQPLDDIPNQTGSQELDTSSTAVPQEDPKEMETDALDRRLAMYAKAGQGFRGLNDRSRGA
jgi:hypothetical protein